MIMISSMVSFMMSLYTCIYIYIYTCIYCGSTTRERALNCQWSPMACRFETGLCREARVAGGVGEFADRCRLHYNMQANVHLDLLPVMIPFLGCRGQIFHGAGGVQNGCSGIACNFHLTAIW